MKCRLCEKTAEIGKWPEEWIKDATVMVAFFGGHWSEGRMPLCDRHAAHEVDACRGYVFQQLSSTARVSTEGHLIRVVAYGTGPVPSWLIPQDATAIAPSEWPEEVCRLAAERPREDRWVFSFLLPPGKAAAWQSDPRLFRGRFGGDLGKTRVEGWLFSWADSPEQQ